VIDIIDPGNRGQQNTLQRLLTVMMLVIEILLHPMWRSILIMLAISSVPIVVLSLAVAGVMKWDVLEDIPLPLFITILPILAVADDLLQFENIILMLMHSGHGGHHYTPN
jgi:hypothetical protein